MGPWILKPKSLVFMFNTLFPHLKKIDIYIRHPKPTWSGYNFSAVCLECDLPLFFYLFCLLRTLLYFVFTSCYGLVLLFDFVELVSLSYFDFTTVFSHE